MLRFQLAKLNFLRGKQLFWLELLLVSAAFHIVFLFSLLVLYSGYRYSTKIVVKRSGVQLLPSYFVNPPCATTVQGQSIQKAAVVKRTSPQKIPSTVMKKEEPKKAAVKKQPVKQIAQAKKQEPTKKEQSKKIENKKKETPKQLTQKKIEPKKEIKKDTAALAKKNTESCVPNAVPISAQQCDTQELCAVPETEFDTVQIQQFIQREISKLWSPPIGLPEDLICNVKIQIGGDGMVSDAAVEESSGVLVYDLSAQAAAVELSLPRWAWGKEFTISFCQE